MQPFHLAFPVKDLEATRAFFQDVLGCQLGRTSDRWIDIDFWGNQITAHLVDEDMPEPMANTVDGKQVPVRHFGAILEMAEWEALAERLRQFGVTFVIAPYVRFQGEVGEQATMFFLEPSGNAVEFKAFRDFSQIFAT